MQLPSFFSYGGVALAATGKFQNKMKQNECYACHNKLVGGTTLQVVFKGRQVNHGKPKWMVIGDLLHEINDQQSAISKWKMHFSTGN